MATKKQQRIFRVKYLYRNRAGISAYLERKARLLIEAPTLQAATPLALRTARRCCRVLGDEIFIRLVSVKEKGVLS